MKEGSIRLTIDIKKEIINTLDDIAFDFGVCRTHVIRTAINEYIKNTGYNK